MFSKYFYPHMVSRFALPVLAVSLLVFAVVHALLIQRPEPEAAPPVPPPLTPFGNTVAVPAWSNRPLRPAAPAI